MEESAKFSERVRGLGIVLFHFSIRKCTPERDAVRQNGMKRGNLSVCWIAVPSRSHKHHRRAEFIDRFFLGFVCTNALGVNAVDLSKQIQDEIASVHYDPKTDVYHP